MGKPHGAVERALQVVLVKSTKDMRERVERDREMGFAEVELQYQLAISGTGEPTPGFTTKTVAFDYPLHYAPGQRDSELERPHFWFGAEVDADVIISASISSWTIDDSNGAVIGAIVRISAMAAADDVAYTGRIHLTFQGFGALADAEASDV